MLEGNATVEGNETPVSTESLCITFVEGRFSPAGSSSDLAAFGIMVQPETSVIHIDANKERPPLRLCHESQSHVPAAYSYALQLADGAELVLLEVYKAAQNTVLTAALGAHAKLQHYKLILNPSEVAAAHQTTATIVQQASSHYSLQLLAIGAGVSREAVDITLKQGAVCSVRGYYTVDQKAQFHFSTRTHHVEDDSHSQHDIRAMASGQGVGAYEGRIVVAPRVKGVVARLVSRNLLLSSSAEITTRPEFEIDSDQIQCSHGATVGTLDEEALFFLQSRGFTREQAQTVLTTAFFNEWLQRCSGPENITREWAGAFMKRVALQEPMLHA